MSNPFNGGGSPFDRPAEAPQAQPAPQQFQQHTQQMPQPGYPQQTPPAMYHGMPPQHFQQTMVSPKSKVVAAVLCFFLGTLGVHNFYLGNKGKAWTQLIFTVLGWITAIVFIGFLFLAVVSVWIFIEFWMIIFGAGSYRYDSEHRPLS